LLDPWTPFNFWIPYCEGQMPPCMQYVLMWNIFTNLINLLENSSTTFIALSQQSLEICMFEFRTKKTGLWTTENQFWLASCNPSKVSIVFVTARQQCVKSKTKRASIMIFSPSESPNIPVFGNMRLIPKFQRGHPEQGQFMRLEWVQTGDFSAHRCN